jgi:hypothetical protein
VLSLGDERRDRTVICVVEQPGDVVAVGGGAPTAAPRSRRWRRRRRRGTRRPASTRCSPESTPRGSGGHPRPIPPRRAKRRPTTRENCGSYLLVTIVRVLPVARISSWPTRRPGARPRAASK